MTASSSPTSLQQHLDAQRASVAQLLASHNAMLGELLSRPVTAPQPPSVATPEAVRVTGDVPAQQSTPAPVSPISRGNVVSLFEYSDRKAADASEAQETINNPDYQVFSENDATEMQRWNDPINSLLAEYGADDALAINRKQMADTIFLGTQHDSLFYLKNQAGILFVVCYVGPDAGYAPLLAELKDFAGGEDLLINLMAHENRVDDLKAAGFSTTPLGIWQRVDPLSEFTLNGSKMRRLRYLVNKYAKRGDCRTEEYVPGTAAETDEAICTVMDQWVELKEQNPPFVAEVQAQIRQGGISGDHRFFLTWRDAVLDNVIVFSRDNMNDGYLMDLEFYSGDMPLGSTEFALSQIIGIFNDEGRGLISLGLTMGTGLFEHENGSEDVHSLFESLRKAEYLNGDANAQYKNKYRPQTTTMYLARPHGCGKKKMNDLLLLLGAG